METDYLIKKKQVIEEKKKKIQIKERLLKEKEKQVLHKKYLHLGKLVHTTGLSNLNEDALLGAFLEIYNNSKNEQKIHLWEREGQNFSAKIGQTDQNQIIICFDSEPNPDTKKTLRELQFKWNAFRKEFYGYGDAKDLEILLKTANCKIEVIDG